MAGCQRSAKQAVVKSGKFLRVVDGCGGSEIQRLRREVGAYQVDLEAKYHALKEALEELEESRNRYAALYDFAPVGFSTLDSKGCIQEVNLTGASLLRMERSQLIGMPMSFFVVKGDLKVFFNHLRRCRLNGGNVMTELSLARASESPVQVQLLSIPQKSFGVEGLHYATVITDITERKIYERERELARLDRLNLIGQIAAGMGHEVRNPMTTVRGFLQLYRNRGPFIEYRDSFDLMINELDRANSIITEFLSLSKSIPFNLKLCKIQAILGNLLPLIEADAAASGIDVVTILEKSPDLFLDEKEIRQMILNLVRNGLEASLPGKNLTIRTFQDGNEVVLSVGDKGEGIDHHILEKIGTPFFTTKDTGTGLGLAICYGIAARHNGVINVDTSPNGSTFFVRFKIPTEAAGRT